MSFKITFRMWIMFAFIAFAIISIFSIPPTFMKKGVLVSGVEKNTTVFEDGLRTGMTILKINEQQINNIEDYADAMHSFEDSFTFENQTQKLTITTDKNEIIDLFSKDLVNQIFVEPIPKTRIITGLDLQGGSRALVKPEVKLSQSEINDLISVTSERLNVYGLSDVVIRQVSDLSGNNYMLVEIAGATPSELRNLISKQGKFEAKIGNETVFVGGKKDITHVDRTGEGVGVYSCSTIQEGEACQFRFPITISPEAADRFAAITKNISINSSNPEYLNEKIEFYIDDIFVNSLYISKDLKGNPSTQHSIQGGESGTTRQEAIKNSQDEMKKLQSVLITGSLPFKLQIEKLDTISPLLGDKFLYSIFLAGISAILAVALIVFIRYRKIKSSLYNTPQKLGA